MNRALDIHGLCSIAEIPEKIESVLVGWQFENKTKLFLLYIVKGNDLLKVNYSVQGCFTFQHLNTSRKDFHCTAADTPLKVTVISYWHINMFFVINNALQINYCYLCYQKDTYIVWSGLSGDSLVPLGLYGVTGLHLGETML